MEGASRSNEISGEPTCLYVLEFRDGETAEPTFLVTELPPEMWQPGQTFLHGEALERLRMVAIDTEAEGVLAGFADGVWIIEDA